MRLSLLAAFLLLAACGQMNTTPDAGPTGNAANGMTLYVARSCNGCHGASGEGNSTGPNVTGSTTAGIGTWTLAEFTKALRESIGKDGMKFCTTMTPYPNLTDQQVADLFAFLQAQKNDTVQRGMACP
ncbi:MAG: cytochrome c [Myxococcaceae bacterium]|nr:cytochrome c [Myxococcaceae bacterium]